MTHVTISASERL